MTTYDLGDAVTISTTVTDINNTPTDATMAILITVPDGTTLTPSPVHGATGQYSVTLTPALSGSYIYKWSATGAIANAGSGQFTVADPAPLLYASLADFKTRLGITDTSHDSALTDALETASRQVDEDCGRRFYLDPTATARIYNPAGRTIRTSEGYKLQVEDIGTATGLVVEIGSVGGGWTAITDFETSPDSALNRGRPVEALLRSTVAWVYSPLHRIRVTARWGWPQVPPQIRQATFIQAQRLWRRKDSPEGVSTYGDFGVMRVGRYDPDYEREIASYKVPGFGG